MSERSNRDQAWQVFYRARDEAEERYLATIRPALDEAQRILREHMSAALCDRLMNHRIGGTADAELSSLRADHTAALAVANAYWQPIYRTAMDKVNEDIGAAADALALETGETVHPRMRQAFGRGA